MNNSDVLAGDFGYSTLESIKAVLSVGRKHFEGRHYDYRVVPQRGFVKDYVKRDAVLVMRLGLTAVPAHYFYLVLSRVPPRKHWDGHEPRPLECGRGHLNRSDHGVYLQTDRVFVVRQRRYGAHVGVPALITIPSLVWLLAPDEVPELLRNGLFPRPLVSQFPIVQSSEGVRPRVVPIFERTIDCFTRCKEHLVEGVLEIVQGVGDVLLEDIGDRVVLDDLQRLLAGCRIFLDDFSKVIECEVGVANLLASVECAVCTVDEFLRSGERGGVHPTFLADD